MGDSAVTARPSLSARATFIRYVFAASLAGSSNLVAQETVVQALPSMPIMGSVFTGTVAGFLVKYWLDKRLVFLDGYDGHRSELRKMFLYSAFSIGTTVTFWVIELGFWFAFHSAAAKYTGAVLGLILGNWIKYLSDRAWVFPQTRS